MGTVILQMLPLALGSIAPIMIGVVILFLSTTNGLAKGIAFVVGKYIAYLIWCFVLLALAGRISSTNPRSTGTVMTVVYVLLGAALITNAALSTTENIISVLVLCLIMIWTLLIPIIAFLVMGERRDTVMKSMREWLNRNQRIINVVVFAFFGIAILIKGPSSILG